MDPKAINIHQKPTRQVGFVLKPHGFGGQLRISLDDDYEPDGFLLLEINQKFVPFKIQSYNPDSGIVKLHGYDSMEKAQKLSNLPILEVLENEVSNGPDLIGYTLTDTVSGLQFEVSAVLEYPGNLLIEFRHGFKDALLPLHEDIVKHIDHETKQISAEFPEGLLDL